MINQIEPNFGKAEAEALKKYILSGGWGTEHIYSELFESKVADFVGIKHCSVVNNGTMGLIIALLAVGVKSGDEVIVPALTMIATANAVRFIGASPIFIDIEPDNLCLDIDKTLKALCPKTKAVIYVSLNGRCGEIERLKGEIPIIEDACQSLGSKHDGKALGTIGDIGVYSLSPHKIISTGQGGLVVTDDDQLYENVERLKDFGRLGGGADVHTHFGINSKFTDFQAVIGLEQIKSLPKRIVRKKQIYNLYKTLLSEHYLFDNSEEVTPWMVDIYGCNKRKFNGFKTRPMYPLVPEQPCYNFDGNFPWATRFSLAGMWLPSSVNLTDKQIQGICKEINE